MIWREKRVLLLILAVLLVANGLFFFTYRVQYEARLSALDAKQKDAELRLQRAHNQRVAAEQQLRSYDKVRTDLQTLYGETWSTQAQRFTALVEEVKRLATRAQLEQPRVYSFSRTGDRDASARFGASGISTVVITFTVKGNYQQIRRLINLLELSNQFVIIDAINLGAGGGSDVLTLNLRLKTLFRDVPQKSPSSKEM